LKSINDLIL